MKHSIFGAVPLALLALAISACPGGDYEIALPHGYFIARVQPDDFGLIAPDRRTVMIRTVKRYRIVHDVVFGETSGGEPLFFILDTRQNSMKKGLAAADWARHLNKGGIYDHTLRRPNPMNAILH